MFKHLKLAMQCHSEICICDGSGQYKKTVDPNLLFNNRLTSQAYFKIPENLDLTSCYHWVNVELRVPGPIFKYKLRYIVYRRIRIGRDDHLDQYEAYDIS